jgi:hypothetical protein
MARFQRVAALLSWTFLSLTTLARPIVEQQTATTPAVFAHFIVRLISSGLDLTFASHLEYHI